jgi:hypothetical protein
MSAVEPGRPVDSVQIATLLGDTVVDVTDVDPTPRRGGGVVVFAVAALVSFLAALGAFAHGVAAAAANHEALAEWIAKGNDALDFAAERISWGWDLIAILGAATGVVCAALAVAAFRNRPRRQFENMIFATGGGEVIFKKPAGATAELDGAAISTDVLPLARGHRLRVQAGAVTWVVTRHLLRSGGFETRPGDRNVATFAIASALAHALVVGLFALVTDDAMGYSSDDQPIEGVIVDISHKPLEDPRQEESNDQGTDNGQAMKQAGSAAEMGQAGKMGDKKATRESGRAEIKKTRENDSVAKRLPGDVGDAGALGVVRRNKAFAAVTGTEDETSGWSDREVFGGWNGHEVAAQRGGFGTGLDGDGTGGGGRHLATIGGNDRRLGPLGPTGQGWKPGTGTPMSRPRRPGDIVVFGTAQVPPGIDKNTIRRYVRQKQSQIAHCYERELLVKPTLSGTVTARWTIDRGGRVLAPSAKGMQTVDSCVAGVIGTIQFPAGEMIEVTAYPFHFRPAGT